MKHIRAFVWFAMLCCCLTAGFTPHLAWAQSNPTSTQDIPSVNGGCGSANGSLVTVKPITNFCNTGTATVLTDTGPWNWKCVGVNNGTTASCKTDLIVDSAVRVSSEAPAILQTGHSVRSTPSTSTNPSPSNNNTTAPSPLVHINPNPDRERTIVQLTDLFANQSTTVNIVQGKVTINVNVARWDTLAYAIAPAQ